MHDQNSDLPSKSEDTTLDNKEILIFEGVYKEEKIFIPLSPESKTMYEKNYFGTMIGDKEIEFEILEALLLIERTRLKVFDTNHQELSAEKLLALSAKQDINIWVKYLVYRDLRQRGYMVRLGYGDGIDFRVYPRGTNRDEGVAKYFVFILAESNPTRLEILDKITQQTINARKTLLLAIVDRLGDPTYYEIEQFKLGENAKKEPFW